MFYTVLFTKLLMQFDCITLGAYIPIETNNAVVPPTNINVNIHPII